MPEEKKQDLSPLEKTFILLNKADAKILSLQKEIGKHSEPIAIIGMGCRFPGGANDPETFWNLLKKGYSGVTEIPKERWNVDEFYDPDHETPGKMYTKSGAFLNVPVDQFDAEFFKISPREADNMDPQQRLLLEVTWEALENAGINPRELQGTKTGVFLGVFMHDYNDMLGKHGNFNDINAYVGTGIVDSVQSGRLSYFLGCQGPSLSINTACSSSLAALHTAVLSLYSGDSNLAIVGGANLMLSPLPYIYECKANMLATDGCCKTFDASADGYGRGEGCGVVILKRLSDAKRDSDHILAVIRSSGVNQDGSSSGLTVPNGEAQTTLIRDVLAKAKIKPDQIDYIEAHGTGTSLGDPIEVHAIEDVMRGTRNNPLWLGSVKANIGHLEGAAGVSGLIKIVLALQNEAIPPHTRFKKLNPMINLDAIPAKIPLELTPWKRGDRSRIAGLSSFGFSGTNAHVVIEEAPLAEKKKNPIDRPLHILALSAKSESALKELLKKYEEYLQTPNENSLADIAYTANTGRAQFEVRTALIGKDKGEVLDALKKGLYQIHQALAPPPKLAFLFNGEGNLDLITGKTLYDTQPIFKRAVDQCAEVLSKTGEPAIFSSLFLGNSSTQSGATLLNLFIVEYALVALWKSWGIVPDFVLGHQGGEYLAAVVAGILSLEDSLKLISPRSHLTKPQAPDQPTSVSDEFTKATQSVTYHTPQLKLISNVTGKVVGREGLNAAYFAESLHKPVKLNQSVETLKSLDCTTLLEIGPKSAELSPDNKTVVLYSLKSVQDEGKTLLDSLSELYFLGFSINWKGFDSSFNRNKVNLPTYPFQRQSYWVKSQPKQTSHLHIIEHPFLGEYISSPLKEKIFANTLDLKDFPYLRDHQIFDLVLFSGTSFIEMIMAAGRRILGNKPLQVANFSIEKPLVLNELKSINLRLVANPENDKGYTFTIYSQPRESDAESTWTFHATAHLSVASPVKQPLQNWIELQGKCPEPILIPEFYANLASQGFHYGQNFQPIRKLWKGNNDLIAELQRTNTEGFVSDPMLLDGSLHATFSLMLKEYISSEEAYLPLGIDKIILYSNLEDSIKIHGHLVGISKDAMSANVEIYGLDGRLLAIVQGLHLRKTNQAVIKRILESDEIIDKWMYEISWIQKPSLKTDSEHLVGNWLIFSEGTELSKDIISKIQDSEAKCLVIEPENSAKEKEDLLNIIRGIVKSESLHGILYLWDLLPSNESFQDLEHIDLRNILNVSKILQTMSFKEKPAFYLISKGVHALDDTPVSLGQTPYVGFFKTMKLELPLVNGYHVDLDSTMIPSANAEFLIEQIKYPDDEDQVCNRKSMRFVPRLKSLKGGDFKEKVQIDPQGSYLITGGLGGLGLECAKWLANKGAKHLVLVGRKAPQDSTIVEIKQLNTLGVIVEIAQIDISDNKATNELIAKFGKSWPLLKGIIHAAGILDDGVLQTQDWNRFQKVLSPKIVGGWNLHQASLSQPLDFFLLFSSLAAAVGAKGKTSYSAGNAFLDGLAHFRRQNKLPALSIAWGTWASVGMAAKIAERIENLGYIPLKPDEGLKALEYALQLDIDHLIIAKLDWKALFETEELQEKPWLEDFIPSKDDGLGKPKLLQKLQNTILSERKMVLKDHLRFLILKALGMQSNQILEDDQDFFNFGMDSIMALEVKNNLQKELGKNYSFQPTMIFEYSNLGKLTEYLFSQITETIDNGTSSNLKTEFNPSSLVIPIKTQGSLSSWFCIHPALGDIVCYTHLSKALGTDRPIYGIRAKGLESKEPLHQNLDELLTDYLAAIRTIQPKGPYSIMGWSGGGIFGSFLVSRLKQQGEEVEAFVCIDCPDVYFEKTSVLDFFSFLKKEMNLNIEIPSDIDSTKSDEERKVLTSLYDQAINSRNLLSDTKFEDFVRQFEIFRNSMKMVKDHFHELDEIYAQKISIFNAQTRLLKTLGFTYDTNNIPLDVESKMSKTQIVDNLIIPCNHFEIIKPPYINQIAKYLGVSIENLKS